MPSSAFNEGVKPGGLTHGTEIRILLCSMLDAIDAPVSRAQLEEVLLGEALVNYFAMAESLGQLAEQGLVAGDEKGYTLTEAGRTVAHTLAQDLPRSVREAAVRGIIKVQQYAARAAQHKSEIVENGKGRTVNCRIEDAGGRLFEMSLFMPNEPTARAVRDKFVSSGDTVYKLVLAALTGDERMAKQALAEMKEPTDL